MRLFKQLSLLLAIVLFTNCVQEKHLKTITVQVDMSSIENPSSVGIRGNSPLSWDETSFLKDEDGDRVYEKTIEFSTANNTFEFKFVNNTNDFELRDQNNRSITFEYQPETIMYECEFDNTKNVTVFKK